MSLLKKSMEEFKKIWKKEFDEEISDQKAYEEGTRLVNFFKLLHEIDFRDKLKKKINYMVTNFPIISI